MQKIKICFQNCYGIGNLNTEFDFSNKRASLIYAPNGAMKTSFAQTFKDHSEGRDSQDRVYPERQTVREITDYDGQPLSAESVFVIEPYDQSYESGRVSTLLANSTLKFEYDDILRGIDKKSSELMTLLRRTSGVRSGLENIISRAFSKMPNNLLRALDRVRREVLEDPEDPLLAEIKFAAYSDHLGHSFRDIGAILEMYQWNTISLYYTDYSVI